MYARVDLGAQVRFDAVQISAPAHGDYCTNANVQVSTDGADWTSIGTYTSSSSRAVTSTYAMPDSVESFRYIQVVLTTARNYWWQLSEIAWGSYDGANFTRAAASGTVTTGTSAATELSFTGTGAGSTYYVIGGTRYVINVEENHVHNYQVTARTAPTCTEAGSITYTCPACGDSYTQTVPALGHDYDAVVTAPACGSGGYTTYTCTRCGESHTADETAALGHDYAAEITPASCTEDGAARYTCTRCGESYTEPIVTTTYRSVSSISSGSSYVITVYSSGKYYALTHTGGALGVTAVTVSNGQIVSDVTDDMLWTYSGGKLGFTSGGANYYLGRYGYSSLSISTSGSRASYSSSRLSLGGYYLRYSNGYFSLNWRSASTCYMFEQTN